MIKCGKNIKKLREKKSITQEKLANYLGVTPQAISRYMGRISGPLLDRIDIQIEVTPVKYQKLESSDDIETSKEIKMRVNKARKIQQHRYEKEEIHSNSQLTPKLIEKYCKLDKEGKNIRSIQHVEKGHALKIQVTDGHIDTIVTGVVEESL